MRSWSPGAVQLGEGAPERAGALGRRPASLSGSSWEGRGEAVSTPSSLSLLSPKLFPPSDAP